MKDRKKIVAILLCFVFALALFVGCGGKKDDGKIELLVDMHGLMPTLNTEPTTENPTVILATRRIQEAFEKENPDIKIK